MENITKLTVRELVEKIKSQELTAVEVVEAYLENIQKKDKDINAFITVCEKGALEQAREIDEKIKKGEKTGPLAGVPYAAKDIFATKGIESTGGSKILKGYKPTTNATAIQRLKEADAILIGKANCDELAQGGTGTHSGYGPTKNPRDLERITGGSSSGSAAAVAADMAAFALATDTGGSIRAPAAFCGVTGVKVTYGRVSRSGVYSMTSSLDTIGPMTKDVEDAALILGIIAGQDERDHTTPPVDVPDYLTEIGKNKDLKGMKFGVPEDCLAEEVNPEVREDIEKVMKKIEGLGGTVGKCQLPHLKYSVPVYYIIMPAESSTNVERLDGVRFGPVVDDAKSLADFYKKNRSRGFGDEVKRRIMIGTYVLSAGFYDAYYLKAMQVRTLIKQDFEKAFQKYDALILPSAPNPAWKFGEKGSPVDEYLEDIFAAPVNLAGLPAVALPSGKTKDGLYLGVQFIGPQFSEEKILGVAKLYEETRGNI